MGIEGKNWIVKPKRRWLVSARACFTENDCRAGSAMTEQHGREFRRTSNPFKSETKLKRREIERLP